MTWYEPPKVEHHDEDGVDVWQLLGDWTRDLPLDVRHRVRAELEAEVGAPIVLDLTDVKFIDSWGEETICDLLQRFRDEGSYVAWTRDASRPSEYEGLKHALERRKVEVAVFDDRRAAIAAAKNKP